MERDINLNDLYDLLTILSTSDNSYTLTEDESFLIKRTMQKIAESDSFARKIHLVFRERESSTFIAKFKESMTGKVTLGNSLSLIYNHHSRDWEVYKGEELYLDKLGWKVTRSILQDINAVALIKHSRETKKNQSHLQE